MAADETIFSKAKAELLEKIARGADINESLKRQLSEKHSLASFIELLSSTDFRRWQDTELESYLDCDGETSLDEVVGWLVLNLKG